MYFHSIRPSSNYPHNQSSESTNSDAAKKTPAESSSSAASKRRRVPESVTRNACINCKKARAKCDGQKPCARCTSRAEALPCVYKIHVKHAKEELVRQIKEFETREVLTQSILQALSADQHVPEILRRLRNGDTYESIAEWLNPSEAVDVTSPTSSQHSTLEYSDHEMSSSASTFRWTAVTSDSRVLDHLFQLYFAWIHPFHTLFSEGHFVASFRTNSPVYCTPVLVNAMCALACHLHTSTELDKSEQLGERFSDAVRADINPEDGAVTTIQAFVVMFLVDCARGSGLRATSYLKVANSLLSKVEVLEDDGFKEVLRNTRRGIRCLNSEWAQLTFQMPMPVRPSFIEADEVDERNDHYLDEAQWYFYRYIDDQCPAWSGLVGTTNIEKAKLTAIIHDVTMMFYNPAGQQIQARQILEQYSRYIEWRQMLPSAISDPWNNDSPALPHVLSLLILYSNSVIHLLRPLFECEGLSYAGIDEIIWKHARTGITLLDQQYNRPYTCRYQPVLQIFSVLHLCDVLVRFFPENIDDSSEDRPEAIKFGLEVLMQSRQGFPVAGTFQELLRRTAVENSVKLPKNLDDLMTTDRHPLSMYKADDFIDACTRPSYLQPVDDIAAMFDANFSADWIVQSPALGFKDARDGAKGLRRSGTEPTAQDLMQISSLLNI